MNVEPYHWPDLSRLSEVGVGGVVYGDILPKLAQLMPEEFFGDISGGDSPWQIPANAGQGTGFGANEASPPPRDPPHVWKAITARASGDVDIQMIRSAGGAVEPGQVYRDVYYPNDMGTPEEGDVGLAHKTSDGSVVFFRQIASVGTHDNPATIGGTSETEAAQSDTWDQTSQGSNDGLQDTRMVRQAYDDSGDETLYGYYRTYTYDSAGKLVAVSAETRVTIDTPEACS